VWGHGAVAALAYAVHVSRPLLSRLLVPLLLVLPLSACSDGAGDGDTRVHDVTVGEEFSFDGFTVADGWELEAYETHYGGEEETAPRLTGTVTNNGDTARAALFRVIFYSGDEPLARINCSTGDLAPGASGPMLCPGIGQVFPQTYDSALVGPIER